MELLKKIAIWTKRRKAEDPEPSLYLYKDDTQKRRVIFITLLDVGSEGIVEIIERTSQKFQNTYRIVYVTDSVDFLVFRERHATFEYIPSLSEQKAHAGTLDWPGYLKARWELLLTKWQPEQILAYGLNVDRFIANAARLGSADAR
ncbi:hypothetical protein [Shinella sp. G-2]|uniref:hypothetical protein n=1 Tax=Shinella sp. G-2 TaxID=3133141 RepID=UPI003D04DA37